MDTRAIDGLLERAVDDGVVPGLVAVVGDRGGVLYEGPFGALSVDGGASVRPDSMFWLASVTKALVSVAALQLIERGELGLAQPVTDILPAFGTLQVLDGFDGDTPRLRAPERQATIRQLASSIVRADLPSTSEATEDSLIPASCKVFSTRCTSRPRSWILALR